MVTLGSRMTALAGIGPKKAEMFGKIGIATVGDLLRHFPRAYQNRGDIRTLAEAGMTGEVSALMLTVATEPSSVLLKNRMVLTKFTAFDDTGRCSVLFFNQNYIKNAFSVGGVYRFWGRLTPNRGKWDLVSPQFEPAAGARPLADLVPVYPLGGGIGQKMMRATVGLALASLDGVEEILPASLRASVGLIGLREALYTIHAPRTAAGLSLARDYFVFEELFLFALAVARAKKENESRPGIPLSVGEDEMAAFLAALPFSLTAAQSRVVKEIAADLASGQAMHRLVSGDVGSGKTVCAAAAAYIAGMRGYQCAMMAPTEILARQHYRDLSPLFASLGLSSVLLVGSLSAAEKRSAREKIASGGALFVVGTHALLSESVRFARPALMITDEQHRFGVRQRASLAAKGENLHVLVMSATPIPRTLALVLYGDLDLSAVDLLPPNRKKVSTFLVDESYRARLNGFIAKQAREGHQVYVVCPAIEGEEDEAREEEDETGGILVDLRGSRLEKPRLRRAVEYAEALKRELPGVSVDCLHGRMPAAEKERVMNDFAAGKTSVLVSTTVIEVGVNVPNATLMIVENAERFGLSQLHQLRGRVGRGPYPSFCVLVSDSKNEESLRRLKALCRTNDGYEIAQFDLSQRGPGDFLAGSAPAGGERQHGELRFRMASLCDDAALLTRAFSEAEALLKDDPDLAGVENRPLCRALLSFREKSAFGLS